MLSTTISFFQKHSGKSQKKILLFYLKKILSNDKIISELKDWRLKRKIPQWIQLVKSDNTLSVNLENDDMVAVFLQTVKTEKSVVIEEFLHNQYDDFRREFIFPMYKVK